MLPRTEAPARQLPYTTADMSERLAKRKAEQEAAAQALANQALRAGILNPPVQKNKSGGGGLWPSWGEIGNAAKTGLGAVAGIVNTTVATPLDVTDFGVQQLEKLVGVKPTDKFDPASIGSFNLLGETYRAIDNAANYTAGNIAAIPGVGKPSSSPFMDTLRSKGLAEALAEPLVHGINVASVAYPASKMAVGAKFPETIANAYRQRLLERDIAAQNKLFPPIERPSNFIDTGLAPDAPPTTPTAARNTNPVPAAARELPPTQRALPAAPSPAELARLQREAARAQLGVNIQDIEFPPKPSSAAQAAMREEFFKAENYMRLRVRDSHPGMQYLPLEELLAVPEFKAHYDKSLDINIAIDPALKDYEQFHPSSWEEIGIAQEKSGFNSQQMPNQMESVRRYFSNEYQTIQSYLSQLSSDPNFMNKKDLGFDIQDALDERILSRYDFADDMRNLVSNMDQAFEVVPPTTKPIIVYRGVDLSENSDPYTVAFYRNLQPGQIIYDPAFSSTSIDKTLASRWASQYDDAILIIRLPVGSKAINPISSWTYGYTEMDTHAHAPKEKELLLPRNTIFKVIKNDGKFIEVEVVQPGSFTGQGLAQNVRIGGKKLSETMSLTEALTKITSDDFRSAVIERIFKNLPDFPSLQKGDLIGITRKIFSNKITKLNNKSRSIFDDLVLATNYGELPPEINKKIINETFSRPVYTNVDDNKFYRLGAKGQDNPEMFQRVVDLIDNQRNWIANNPGQIPEPIFVDHQGNVIDNPRFERSTFNDPIHGYISGGIMHQVYGADRDDYFRNIRQYREQNPEFLINDGYQLFDYLAKYDLLNENNLDTLKNLFSKHVEQIYAPQDASWKEFLAQALANKEK